MDRGGAAGEARGGVNGRRPFLVSRRSSLGVMSARRSAQVPEVPTFAEQGIKGYRLPIRESRLFGDFLRRRFQNLDEPPGHG